MPFSRICVHRWAAFAAIVSSTPIAAPALAQARRSAVTSQIEEIIVTARKREEVASDVPAALTVFSDEAIRETGAREISDFIEAAPSVSMVNNGALQQLSIRGVSTSLGGNANGYYLDNVPFTGVSVPWNPNVQPFDVERVEVLRGPQGTLFGEGSMGGTVRILTRAPGLDGFSGRFEAVASDTEDGDGSTGGRAMVNIPIAKDVAAVRLVALREDRGGWLQGLGGEQDYNDDEITTYRGRLRIVPTSNLTLDFGAWKYDQDVSGTNESFDNGLGAGRQPLSQGYEQYSASGALDTGWGEIRYSFGQNDLTNTLLTNLPGLGTLNSDIDILVRTHELLASGEAGPVSWTAGYYYRLADRDDGLVLAGGPLPLALADNYESEAQAVFAEGEYSFNAHWRLALGVRVFEEDLEVRENGVGFTGPVDVAFGDSFDSVNPRIILTFEPNDDHLFYASAAKGFRGGQAQPAAAVQLAGLLGLPLPATLPPDSIWTYELGSKLRLMNGRVFVESALFYSEWTDPTVRFVLVPGVNGLATAEGIETRGFELAGTYRFTDHLTFRGGASFLDSEFTSSVPGSSIVAGDPPEQTSDVTWNASLTYDAPVFGDFDLFGRVGAQFTSAREFTIDPTFLPGDDVTLVDARLGVENGRFGVFLFGDNLTDDNGALSARTTLGAVRARPQTIGIELTASF